MGYEVGIDVGGTFTDLIALEPGNGRMRFAKVPSTPPTFVEGVLHGLQRIGLAGTDIDAFRHGSTIATNAIIERRGVPTALITTGGMRDILTAARSNRPDLFDLRFVPAPHLVERRNILTITERVNYEGQVLTPLNEAEVRQAARVLTRRGIRAVAVCFLNSFLNPSHEARAKQIIQEECPDAYICTSSEILPEIREFERTSTVVVNAYLGPILARYLDELNRCVAGWGYGGQILLTHSGGGIMGSRAARQMPVRVCQSGPASGVMGGAFLGRLAGFDNVITLDVGGTSADIALVSGGRPLITTEWRVEFNIPINIPAIDLKALGAGGGTIGWVDAAGILRNGPHSAGAEPGPACYGKGGVEPTNTDAQIVLGRLNPNAFLGGEMRLDPDLAHRAVEMRLARRMGMDVQAAADGMLQVANANMVNGIRLATVQRGHDPRDLALVAFGGAGPLHAAELAAELKIPTVVVPRYPGLTSALGTLYVDYRHDFLRSVLRREDEVSSTALQALFRELEQEAAEALRQEGVPAAQTRIERLLDMRYYGQVPYLQIHVPAGEMTDTVLRALVEEFNRAHMREYGYTMPPEINRVEIVNARVVAYGLTPNPHIAPDERSGTADDARVGTRPVYFREAGGYVETTILDRERLLPNAKLSGPVIVEQRDSTIVVPPGWQMHVDRYLNLILTVR